MMILGSISIGEINPAVAGGVLAACFTALFGILMARRTHRIAETDRRRDLYSQAFRTALEWCEAVYRVRRRPSDGSGDQALVDRFHDLQERIAFYEGWLATESAELGQSYAAFMRAVMSECRPLLQDAWTLQGRSPTTERPPTEVHPELTEAKTNFERDVREHQSRRWWVRRRVKSRYPEK